MSLTPYVSSGTILLVGASRGIGLAVAEELLKRGWHVVGTIRGTRQTPLHALLDRHAGRLEIEQLDVTEPVQIAMLHERLAGRIFDILFVNAGIGNPEPTVTETSTEEFVRVMITNALSPMRVIDGLQDLVAPEGTIGVMSSGQGSVANNIKGGHEVYRSSKAALNQFMRSYAARNPVTLRSLVTIAPGWIRTELGGSKAPYSLEETVPGIVEVLLAQKGQPGLRYLDREGNTVPW